MPNLDDELRRRLIEKFGPTIDLRARPEVLRDLVAEIVRNPAVFISASDSHYKGDIHTKEMVPGKPPYERQYLRGVAMGERGGDIDELMGEIHAHVDRMLLQALREGLKALDARK
jgi:hypothetical protein